MEKYLPFYIPEAYSLWAELPERAIQGVSLSGKNDCQNFFMWYR